MANFVNRKGVAGATVFVALSLVVSACAASNAAGDDVGRESATAVAEYEPLPDSGLPSDFDVPTKTIADWEAEKFAKAARASEEFHRREAEEWRERVEARQAELDRIKAEEERAAAERAAAERAAAEARRNSGSSNRRSGNNYSNNRRSGNNYSNNRRGSTGSQSRRNQAPAPRPAPAPAPRPAPRPTPAPSPSYYKDYSCKPDPVCATRSYAILEGMTEADTREVLCCDGWKWRRAN